MGKNTATDVSSATDASVYEHVLDHICRVKSMTLEQPKGDICDDPLTQNGLGFLTQRAIGTVLDTMKFSAETGKIEVEIGTKSMALFEVGFLTANESAEGTSKTITGATYSNGIVTFTATSHGLAVNDLVTVSGVTPSGYNGSYRVLTVPTANTFTVALASNPGAYSSGGSAIKLAMFYFDMVEGLAAGDVVKFYEKNGTYENVTIVYVDTVNSVL